MKRPRWLGYAVAGGLGLALVFWLIRPEQVQVETAAAVVAPLMETVGDEGMTRVRDRHLVTAPVDGRVERIPLEPGDRVRRGDVVARLHPLALDLRHRDQAAAAVRAALERQGAAESKRAEARVALAEARRNRERAEPLLAAGGIARAEVERLQFLEAAREREVSAAEFEARAAAQDVAAARAALTGASSAGSGTRAVELHAPATGLVLAIPERSARAVTAGATLVELGDPASLEIVVDLLSADAVRVSPGDRMLVSGWGGGDSVLCAWVRRVEPSAFTKVSALGVEEQRVNIVGDLEDLPPQLGDRFRVEVRVVLWEEERVLQVPASAVFRHGEEWAVFVADKGRARERIVHVGHTSTAAIEIRSGLDAGNDVIRHPTDRVADGVRIRVRN